MKIFTPTRLTVGGGLVLAGLAFVGARARATGPSNVPVFFTGSLMNNGQPLAGQHQVAFDLWDDSTATSDSSHVCTMPAAAVTVGTDGFFQIALSIACAAGIPTHPSLWYQFAVDGTAFPRTSIGAVPFAYWAGAANSVLKPVAYTTNDGGTTTTTYVSALGSVCGTTAPTNGSFSDPAFGTVGLQASKTLCQSACSSPTAHICLREDLDRFAKILGGSVVTTTGWVEDTLTECGIIDVSQCTCTLAGGAMPMFSGTLGVPHGPAYTTKNPSVPYPAACVCNGTPVPRANLGTIYGPNGGVGQLGNITDVPAPASSFTCDAVHPILCCD